MKNAAPASTQQPTSQAGRRRPETSSVIAAAVISWLGLLVHNVADLRHQTLLSPETLGPSLVAAALLAVYATGSVRLAGVSLFGWALLNLGGGTLSVLPLSVLPFEPEQTLRHYSFHLLYAATQVPLLVVSYQFVVDPRSGPSREPDPKP